MSTNTTKLLPAVVENAVKPKPTKRELIEALARIQIEKIVAENKANEELRHKLDDEIESGLKSIVRRRGTNKFSVSAYHGKAYKADHCSASITISFKHEDLTEPLIAKIKQHAASKHLAVPTLSEAKRQVAAKIEGLTPSDTRVDALLADSASKKALEAMLTALSA